VRGASPYGFANILIISGAQSAVGYSNSNRGFVDTTNYFDVLPPTGYVMGNLVAFIPSLHVLYFSGGVDGNDNIRTTYAFYGDRIRVWVGGTEQRATPYGNWLAVWGKN
jgi:hypothetical protein